MKLLKNWLAPWPAASRTQQLPHAVAEPRREETWRELLLMAVRDTLRKHGIPGHLVSPQTFPAPMSKRTRGMHLSLIVKEWQPTLLGYSVAIQKAIEARPHRVSRVLHQIPGD